jgi:hypothetical protein
MTNEELTSVEAAYEKLAYYIQRWKLERFHYVLKSGCKIEYPQERTMEKMKKLILIYSVIAAFIMNTAFIMNLTYIGCVYPDIPCSLVFDEGEWKLLYCFSEADKRGAKKSIHNKRDVGLSGLPRSPETRSQRRTAELKPSG